MTALPNWIQDRVDKKEAKQALATELAVMLDSEVMQDVEKGYCEVTIGRASQLLRLPVSRIGENLSKAVTRQMMQNYKNRDCHARVYIGVRRVEIIDGDKEINQGVMP